jgi:hypothetical protein
LCDVEPSQVERDAAVGGRDSTGQQEYGECDEENRDPPHHATAAVRLTENVTVWPSPELPMHGMASCRARGVVAPAAYVEIGVAVLVIWTCPTGCASYERPKTLICVEPSALRHGLPELLVRPQVVFGPAASEPEIEMLSLKLPQFWKLGVGLPCPDDPCVRVENGRVPKLTDVLVSWRHAPPPNAVTLPTTEPLSGAVAVNAGTTLTESAAAIPIAAKGRSLRPLMGQPP